MNDITARSRSPIPASALIAVLGIAVLAILYLPLWNSRPQESHKIYFVDNISPAHRVVIDRFNALHRGSIEVVPVDLPFSKFSTNERKELLARALRNKSDRIDVFAVDLIWVPRFSKWSHPLGLEFGEGALSGVIENALESCHVDNVLVAMPLYLDIGLMYYRRDVLQRFPQSQMLEERLRQSITWDEFLHLNSELNAGAAPYYVFPAKDYEGLMCSFYELAVGQLDMYSNKAPLDLRSPEARRALQLMVDLVHKLRVSPAQVADFDENRSYDFMLARDAVFCRGWPNFLENYLTFYPDTAKLRSIGRAALPHFKGMRPRSVFGGWNLMVSKYSNKKAEAVAFIRFLQSEESQKTMFEVGGYLPVSRSVYADSAYMARHPNLAYYNQLMANGFHRPALADYTRISDIVSQYLHRAIKGEIAVDDALEMAARDIQSGSAREE